MGRIELSPNTRRVSWPDVVWSDGSRMPVILDPDEGWFDEDGYLRFFSLQFPDRTVGNYLLLPRDQSVDLVLRIAKDVLLPFGLTVASNAVFAGGSIVHNIAQEVFEQFGQIVIGDYFERIRIANSAYYNVARGWCVIEQPLKL